MQLNYSWYNNDPKLYHIKTIPLKLDQLKTLNFYTSKLNNIGLKKQLTMNPHINQLLVNFFFKNNNKLATKNTFSLQRPFKILNNNLFPSKLMSQQQPILGAVTKRVNELKINRELEPKLNKHFKLYMQINYSTNFSSTRTHASGVKHFFYFSKKGLVVSNINKIFQKWKNIYYLLFNLYFYKIKLLFFGTVFFKNEIQSLNWLTSAKIKFIWRYAHSFIFFTPNKLTNVGNLLFEHLKLVGYSSAVLLDTTYHKYTLNYLTKLHYFTIGLIPANYNYKSVDLAIPVSIDSIFSQLFFTRLVLNIKQQTLNFSHKKLKNDVFIPTQLNI